MEVASECMRRCRSQQHGAAICAAILRGSEEEAVAYMRWLCANCAQVTDNWGRTALHVAASKGRRRVVEWLVKHRDAVLNARDQESGYTPLHRSLFYGQIDVAISLLKVPV
jgi:ankyrin repeat protein